MKTFFILLALFLAAAIYKVYWLPAPVDPAQEQREKVTAATVTVEKLSELKKGVESGDRIAQYELGLLYARGADNLKQDFKMAHDLLYKASMQGVPQAMYHLGEMYVWGDGGETNYEEATVWFWLATSLGDKYSERRLRAINTRISAKALADAQVRVEQMWKEIPHDLKIERQSMH